MNTSDKKVLKNIDSRKSYQLLKVVKIKTIRGHHELRVQKQVGRTGIIWPFVFVIKVDRPGTKLTVFTENGQFQAKGNRCIGSLV